MPQAPHAVTLGEGLARRAVELLDEPRHCSNPAAELRAEADGLLAGARSADRGETRELTLSAMQAGAVAGKAFVDSGGMSQLERTLERGLEAQSQLSARDAEAWSRGVAGAELLLAFEVLHALHSVPVALAALQGRACSLVCRLIDAAKTLIQLAHLDGALRKRVEEPELEARRHRGECVAREGDPLDAHVWRHRRDQ